MNGLWYALGGLSIVGFAACTAKILMQERFYGNKQMIRRVFYVAMIFISIGFILVSKGGAKIIDLLGSGVL